MTIVLSERTEALLIRQAEGSGHTPDEIADAILAGLLGGVRVEGRSEETVTPEEVAELERAFDALNEAAGRITGRLDRINGALATFASEIGAARDAIVGH